MSRRRHLSRGAGPRHPSRTPEFIRQTREFCRGAEGGSQAGHADGGRETITIGRCSKRSPTLMGCLAGSPLQQMNLTSALTAGKLPGSLAGRGTLLDDAAGLDGALPISQSRSRRISGR